MNQSDMGRRAFMGTVIGASVATGLPFVAKAASPEIAALVKTRPSPLTQKELLLKFLMSSPAEQMRYKFFLFLDEEWNDVIFGSKIVKIERQNASVVITPEEIEMRRDLTIHGLIFADPDNVFVAGGKYGAGLMRLSGPSWVKDPETGRDKRCRGDILKHTYTLTIN